MGERAIVVGAGVVGLSAARALRERGFAVEVVEQHRVGTPLGCSPGPSRIYRRAYHRPEYVRLAIAANKEWRRLDPSLLLENGVLNTGPTADVRAQAFEACGIEPEWLEPAEAERLFPEARFLVPALHDREGGVVLAHRALEALRAGLDVREGVRVDDPRALLDEADVVCVCAGAWLGRLFELPLKPQLEQVSYFAGAPETRPSTMHHATERGDLSTYGLVTPGLGYKLAEDDSRPERYDPDEPGRPIDPEVTARLVDVVRERYPGLDPAPIRTEACTFVQTPDDDFVLDTIDGVIVCGGDSGHAFKLAPALGQLCADLAVGRSLPAELSRLFRADRFGSPVPDPSA